MPLVILKLNALKCSWLEILQTLLFLYGFLSTTSLTRKDPLDLKGKTIDLRLLRMKPPDPDDSTLCHLDSVLFVLDVFVAVSGNEVAS